MKSQTYNTMCMQFKMNRNSRWLHKGKILCPLVIKK